MVDSQKPHSELQTEANLRVMKYQGWFYHVSNLRLLGMVTLRVQVLERANHWLVQKKLGLKKTRHI